MFYQNKKQISDKFKIVISSLLIAGVVFGFGAKPQATAQTADDLQQQKNDKQKQLDAINAQIAQDKDQISQTQKQANTLANQLKTINLELAETQSEIDATNNQIDSTNLEISDVTDKIVQTQTDIDAQKTILKSLIGDINDLDQRSPLEIALENDNWNEFLDQVQYVSSIQEQSQEALTKVKALESDLQTRQDELKTEKTNLDQLQAQLTATQNSQTQQQKAKQDLLTLTKGQEKVYQKVLSDSQEQQKDLNDEINQLDDQIAAKLGNNKLTAHHGLLAYPMNGTLTQGYGNTGFTALGYSFHNGIDIAAPAGTAIHAAGDGTVIATGNATSSGEDGAYGNWVAIKHDQGKFAAHPIITLYGHMSKFIMRTGQVVHEGDVVGYEGNTGNTTRILYGPSRGFHLHFTVFDAQGFGVTAGAYPKIYGPYTVPYGAPYNPLDFL